MNIWQRIYNWFRSLRYPAWLRPYIQELNDIMIMILKKAGQAYIDYLKGKIIEAAKENWTNKEKFNWVLDQAKIGLKEFTIELKDDELKAIIDYFVSTFKKQGIIK